METLCYVLHTSASEIDLGVPQGSVLGLLYLIYTYIHVVHDVMNFVCINFFLDDTSVICNILNTELNVLCGWLCGNCVRLNFSKAKCVGCLVRNFKRYYH